MVTIRVRNIPDEVVDTFRRRADVAGQSLQAYLLEHLIRAAGQPDIPEDMAMLEESPVNGPGPGISEETFEEPRRELELPAERDRRTG